MRLRIEGRGPGADGRPIAVIELETVELTVLEAVAAEVEGLLESVPEPDPFGAAVPLELGAGLDEGDDAAVHRLLPPGSGDPESAAEFRRYAQQDIALAQRSDSEALRRAIIAGATAAPMSERSSIELDDESRWQWMRALTHARLVMSERMAAAEDEGVEAHESVRAVFDWLGGLQESIVRVDDEIRRRVEERA